MVFAEDLKAMRNAGDHSDSAHAHMEQTHGLFLIVKESLKWSSHVTGDVVHGADNNSCL